MPWNIKNKNYKMLNGLDTYALILYNFNKQFFCNHK